VKGQLYYVSNQVNNEGSEGEQSSCYVFDQQKIKSGTIRITSCSTTAGVICQRPKSTKAITQGKLFDVIYFVYHFADNSFVHRFADKK